MANSNVRNQHIQLARRGFFKHRPRSVSSERLNSRDINDKFKKKKFSRSEVSSSNYVAILSKDSIRVNIDDKIISKKLIVEVMPYKGDARTLGYAN